MNLLHTFVSSEGIFEIGVGTENLVKNSPPTTESCRWAAHLLQPTSMSLVLKSKLHLVPRQLYILTI